MPRYTPRNNCPSSTKITVGAFSAELAQVKLFCSPSIFLYNLSLIGMSESVLSEVMKGGKYKDVCDFYAFNLHLGIPGSKPIEAVTPTPMQDFLTKNCGLLEPPVRAQVKECSPGIAKTYLYQSAEQALVKRNLFDIFQLKLTEGADKFENNMYTPAYGPPQKVMSGGDFAQILTFVASASNTLKGDDLKCAPGSNPVCVLDIRYDRGADGANIGPAEHLENINTIRISNTDSGGSTLEFDAAAAHVTGTDMIEVYSTLDEADVSVKNLDFNPKLKFTDIIRGGNSLFTYKNGVLTNKAVVLELNGIQGDGSDGRVALKIAASGNTNTPNAISIIHSGEQLNKLVFDYSSAPIGYGSVADVNISGSNTNTLDIELPANLGSSNTYNVNDTSKAGIIKLKPNTGPTTITLVNTPVSSKQYTIDVSSVGVTLKPSNSSNDSKSYTVKATGSNALTLTTELCTGNAQLIFDMSGGGGNDRFKLESNGVPHAAHQIKGFDVGGADEIKIKVGVGIAGKGKALNGQTGVALTAAGAVSEVTYSGTAINFNSNKNFVDATSYGSFDPNAVNPAHFPIGAAAVLGFIPLLYKTTVDNVDTDHLCLLSYAAAATQPSTVCETIIDFDNDAPVVADFAFV